MLKSLLRVTGGVVVGSALLLAGFGLIADSGNGSDDGVVIEIRQDEIPEYRELASELGLDYDRDYGYRDWRLEVLDQFQSWQPGVGDCGTWTTPKECEQQPGYSGLELLYCSHGRDTTNNCDMRGEEPFIETVYLSKRDMTLLTKMQLAEDGAHMKVELLRLAEGRRPNLHKS